MQSRSSAFWLRPGSSVGDLAVPLADAAHLVRRFFGAIKPGAPPAEDEAWAVSHLGDGETALWHRMNNPDQRHAIEVARAVVAEMGDPDRPVVAAALLHDVGKVVSGYRTPARVVATVLWAVAPDGLADQWLEASGPRKRMAEYRRHPELGEQLLANAGADEFTSSWAGDHHRPEPRWRVDPAIGAILKACDDD